MKNEKKAGHTPGPWMVSAHEDNGEIVVRSPATLNIICNCEADGFGEVGGKETSANARLIAAAPELLEALGSVMDTLEEARIELAKRGYLAEDRPAWDEDVIAARAAIAKAKGEK